MCVSVWKDLANRCTDMVFLHSEASHWSWEGLYLIWGRISSITLPREIALETPPTHPSSEPRGL